MRRVPEREPVGLADNRRERLLDRAGRVAVEVDRLSEVLGRPEILDDVDRVAADGPGRDALGRRVESLRLPVDRGASKLPLATRFACATAGPADMPNPARRTSPSAAARRVAKARPTGRLFILLICLNYRARSFTTRPPAPQWKPRARSDRQKILPTANRVICSLQNHGCAVASPQYSAPPGVLRGPRLSFTERQCAVDRSTDVACPTPPLVGRPVRAEHLQSPRSVRSGRESASQSVSACGQSPRRSATATRA